MDDPAFREQRDACMLQRQRRKKWRNMKSKSMSALSSVNLSRSMVDLTLRMRDMETQLRPPSVSADNVPPERDEVGDDDAWMCDP